jgi:hypothetical protein
MTQPQNKKEEEEDYNHLYLVEDDCDDVIILNLKINDCFFFSLFSFLWLGLFFFKYYSNI